MKFLMADGTIEDGQLLTDEQATLREELERYLHLLVCNSRFHANYEGKPCQTAANLLATKVSGEVPLLTVDIREAANDLPPKHVPARPKAMDTSVDKVVAEPVAAVKRAEDMF